MNKLQHLDVLYGRGICYSGFRTNQNPGEGIYPSYEEVKEDMHILKEHWDYIRIYDAGVHAETVLEVIFNEKIDLKVMIGTCLDAEVNNPECPWGSSHEEHVLDANKKNNEKVMEDIIRLANKYPSIVFSVSVGNEATVAWNDHMVPVQRVRSFVKYVKANITQPVTFCENYVPWQGKLDSIAEEVDFISIHTYPVWEYRNICDALAYTIENYQSVKSRFPDKEIVITEAGWTTKSNGQGIPVEHVSEALQGIYCKELEHWSKENKVLTFVFEAFDEDWKGSSDPNEPEKHWGLYNMKRKPKEGIYYIFGSSKEKKAIG